MERASRPCFGAAENPDAVMYAEYLGEGMIEPTRMVRKGQYKYITVNGYPPLLFDVAGDPDESTNIAGQAK